MKSYLRRVYRERRRLIIFATAATLSGYLWFQGDPDRLLGLPIAIWMAITFGISLTIPAALLTRVAPDYRFALETVGISLLLYSIVMVRLPNYSFLSETAGLAPFVAFLVLSNLVHVLFYGDWSEKRLRLRRHSERSSAHSTLPRETAWKMLLPSAQREFPYWDPTVVAITHVGGTEGEVGEVVKLAHLFPNGKKLDQQIRLDHMNPGQSLRYHYSVPEAINGAQNEQTCAFVLEEEGTDLHVHVRWDRPDYPMRRALMHWIDDWAGRALDQTIARVEKIAAEKHAQDLTIKPLIRRRDGKSGL